MSEIYNAEYYHNGCGPIPYEEPEHWVQFFGMIADRIVADLNPKTVLDAGCAMGYLVAALRDRGVEAYGVDISDYAISMVREDIKPYCRVGSLIEELTEELPQHFDLVVTIEVLEHLYAEDGKKMIENLCSLADTVLFSSTPDDFEERTHVNVQQREYWARLFAQNGFYDQVFYDATYVSPHALLFKKNSVCCYAIEEYERKLRILSMHPHGRTQSKVYFDTGAGESESNCLSFKTAVGKIFRQKIIVPADCITLRFDPFEGMGGMVYNLSIRTINAILQVSSHNGLQIENMILFQTHDPQIRIELGSSDSPWVEICAEILPIEETGWLALYNCVSSLLKERNDTAKGYKNFQEKVQTQLNDREAEIESLNSCIESLQSEITDAAERNKKLQAEIQDYSNLIAYERGEAQRISNALSCIQNSTIWRMTKPLRRLLDFIKHLLRLFKKVLVSIRRNGLKATLRKIRNKISGQKGSRAIICQDNKGATRVSITGHPIDPIKTIMVADNVKRINLVTDTIDSGSLLGGVATALIVATEFANRFDYELRIITRNSDTNPHNYENIIQISGIQSAKKISFYSDVERHEKSIDFLLEVGENDIFFATSWWSAKAIEDMRLKNRFFYIIQEVETFFYNFGSEHLMCAQMMNHQNIDYIINSKYLYDYFAEHNPNIVNHGCYFEPAFPLSLYKCKKFKEKEKFKLFFYARPNNPRNLYSFGVEMLEKAISIGILDTERWDVYCVGQQAPEITFSNGYKSKNLGQLSWTEYAEFLSDVDLGLCLMYTPHPSYPPYDVACSGGVVLSNKMLNKVEFKESKNVILSSLDEAEFLSSFEQAIVLAQNMQKRKKNYEENSIRHNWDETLNDTILYMGTCLGIV